MKLITIEEDKEFLQLQRRKGRPGKMGSPDVALLKIESLKLKRQEDLETRRALENTYKLVHEEYVVLMPTYQRMRKRQLVMNLEQ